MSGIFGFTCRKPTEGFQTEALGGLEYWNRIYGRDASESTHFAEGAMGCHVEHFSERFPYGGPVLTCRGQKAVVDALLYNRDELLPALELPSDSTISDEELLLTLIDKKGFKALSMVNGDFAGAIYNETDREWILFRDHLGVRPLYLYHDQDLIVFSSDLRGILAVPGVDCGVDEENLYVYLINANSLYMQKTDFAKIICALPGAVTRLRMTDSGITRKEKPYWTIRSKKIRMKSDEDYRQEMRRLITDAVHRRCDAIPGLLGAELSGGLDSSVIDILINRHGRDAVYFSWSSDPKTHELQKADERQVILDICEQERIDCKFLSPKERFDFDYVLANVYPPYMNTLHLSFGSRWMHDQGARVVFTGHGGDEGVSNRCRRYQLFCNFEWWSYFKYYWQDTKGLKLHLLRTIYAGLMDARTEWKRMHYKPTAEDLHLELLTEDFNRKMAEQFVLRPDPFRSAPYKYVKMGGTRDRLENAACQGAACGVRYLFPFVDHRVMDFAVSIPRRLYLGRNVTRKIYRDAFADLMPQSLRDVHYKDLLSGRNAPQPTNYEENFRKQKAWLCEHLDREFWKDILDYDAILRMECADFRSKEYYMQNLVMSNLMRAMLIQNCVKEAPRWKEREA